MATSFNIRPFLAAFLLFSLLFSTVLRATHGLLFHKHQHERLHCSPEKEGKGTHIHGDRFAPNYCSLCEFVFQACSFSPLPVHATVCEAIPTAITLPIYEAPVLRRAALDTAPGRGPPTL